MERLVIEIPDNKSKLVKQILKEFGVNFKSEMKENLSDFQKALLKVSVWSEKDIKELESVKPFEGLKPAEW